MPVTVRGVDAARPRRDAAAFGPEGRVIGSTLRMWSVSISQNAVAQSGKGRRLSQKMSLSNP
jgi:hypothetical protein